MDSNRYKTTRGSFLALASLLIVFLVPQYTEAASNRYSLTTDGNLTMYVEGINIGTAPVSNIAVCLFNSKWATSTINCDTGVAGWYTAGSYSGSLGKFATLSGRCTASSTTNGTITCDLDNMLSTQTGDFYFALQSGTNKNFFYNFRRNTDLSWEPAFGVDVNGFNSVTETRFTDIDFSGTSTVNINVQYYLDQDEINTTVSAFNPTLVQFRYALRPDTNFSSRGESISNTTYGTSTVDTDITGLADGVYDLNVIFSNQGVAFGADRPFPQSYIYTSFTITGGVLSSTSTIEYYNGLEPLDPEKYQPCSVTELSGCLSNSLLYLFYPSSAALTEINDTYDTLSTKFPFAYFTDFNDSISGLYTGTQTATSTITVPFGDFGNITLISAAQISAVPFTSLIRSLLGSLIWVMLGFTIYRRTQKIFNSNQETV